MQRSSPFAGQTRHALTTALPSSLGSRTASTLPPSSTTYEPLAKAVLAHRFVRQVLAISLGFAILVSALWTSWDAGGIPSIGILSFVKNCLSPSAITLTLGWGIFAVLPVAVLRKRHVQVTSPLSLSPSQTLAANVKKTRYLEEMMVLCVSALSTTMLHACMADALSKRTAGLDLFAGSKKHPLHLNGRLMYLFFSQFTVAALYWTRDLLKGRFIVRWSREENFSTLVVSSLLGSLVSIALLSILSSSLSLIAFGFARSVILPLVYRLPIVHGILRPFVAHFLRPTFTLTLLFTNFDVVIRAALLSLTTISCWDVASTTFDIAFSIPVKAAEGSSDVSVTLTSGLTSSNSYFQFQALNELANISCSHEDSASAIRQALFNDSKHSPSLWASVCRQCLLLLGRDYQHFLRRGQPLPPPKAPVPAPPPASSNFPRTPIKRENIYKNSRMSPLGTLADSFASDGLLSQATAEQINVNLDLSFLRNRVRDEATASLHGVTDALAKEATIVVEKPVKGILSGWDKWFARERVDRAAMKILPNKDADILIVQILSHLISCSLREDGFGHVQRDIPRVLEAHVLFLSAIDAYQAELSALADSPNHPIPKPLYLSEIARAGEWVDELGSELRTGLTLIVNTFGDRLNRFSFPSNVARELQKFADYVP